MRPVFPYFGNKMEVVQVVWERFGDPAIYVEPFGGSLAVLLGRPGAPRLETVNELDGFITNFFRAVQVEPEKVAVLCDQLVNEIDMESRHKYMVAHYEELVLRLQDDPTFYDVEFAGWWVWGLCAWIGGEWCTPSRARQKHMPDMPQKGVHKRSFWEDGKSRERITRVMADLSLRLRGVRILNGDWKRCVKKSVLKSAVLAKGGVSAAFLDPPYSDASRDMNTYQHDCANVALDVLAWCIENGSDPTLRLALCGYEGEHDVLAREHGWEVVEWKAIGGYGRLGGADGVGMENRHRERIWFSPHCIQPGRLKQVSLFEAIGAIAPGGHVA